MNIFNILRLNKVKYIRIERKFYGEYYNTKHLRRIYLLASQYFINLTIAFSR